jgi:hypothetical protein
MQFLPPAIYSFSVPRSAPLRGNGARAVPIIVAQSGVEWGTMGTPLEQCNFFPQLSIISPFLVPLRSVGTGQGLYQSLSLGAERSGERWVHHLNNAISSPSYLLFLRSSFRSAPWERGKGCTNHCRSERSGTRNGERMGVMGKIVLQQHKHREYIHRIGMQRS